jgi:L-amino acid N-acyltransferase YncA
MLIKAFDAQRDQHLLNTKSRAMKSSSSPKHAFPMRYTLGGRSFTLGPLRPEHRQALIELARSLPSDDLLFLDRDLTDAAEVDRWIQQALARPSTILASDGGKVLGYATYDRGGPRWLRHVAELRVVVGPGARGIGLGRLLLELAFELALTEGVSKVIARMTPSQVAAARLFRQLGFEQEAVLSGHAKSSNGTSHDLLVLSFRAQQHPEQVCQICGMPVLNALSLDRRTLCSQCHELRYQELGGEA